MDPLERAKQQVASYLSSFVPQPDIVEAIDLLIESRQAEALQYVGEYATADPGAMPLERLWAIVDSGDDIDPEAQAAALAAITNVLLSAWEDLDFDFPLVDEPPLMTQAEIDGHVARLLATYRNPTYDKLVRRRALEYAANISHDESIVSAGHGAFRADDLDWVRTGLVVVTLSDPEQAHELIDEALSNEAVEVRCQAIEALGRLEREDDVERLAAIAQESDDPELDAALTSLARMPLEEAGAALFRLSSADDEPAVRAAEAWDAWFDEYGAIADMLDELDDELDDELMSDDDLDDALDDLADFDDLEGDDDDD